MAKLFSKMKIIRRDKKGVEEVIPKGRVFDATPTEAKQFDKLKSSRPATPDEIKADEERKAMAKGQAFTDAAPAEPVAETTKRIPDSGAAGDPNSPPKGKTA